MHACEGRADPCPPRRRSLRCDNSTHRSIFEIHDVDMSEIYLEDMAFAACDETAGRFLVPLLGAARWAPTAGRHGPSVDGSLGPTLRINHVLDKFANELSRPSRCALVMKLSFIWAVFAVLVTLVVACVRLL
jgi:hypothetical protein